MFGPASRAFEAAALVVCAGSVVLTVIGWNRVRGWAWLRITQRVALVLLCQVLAIASAFAVVNRANFFYLTWAELAGAADPGTVSISDESPAAVPSPSITTAGALPSSPVTTEPVQFTPDSSGLLVANLTGHASGVTGQVLVWTPPGYSPKGPPLPVLLALPGYPGNPIDAIKGLGMPTAVPQLIASGALPPMIIVAATTNIGGKEWGCADTPGGPRVDTWLSQDVPTLIRTHFHVRLPSRWSVLGLSSGATCAVRLTLLHPDLFGAAVSLAGSNAPESPALTGDKVIARSNNLLTLIAAGASRPVSLLLAASRQDPGTFRDAEALQQSHGPNASVDLETVATGGHNWAVWVAMTPPALTWLGKHLDP